MSGHLKRRTEYKQTGMNFESRPRDRILRRVFAATYKRCRFQIASHPPRVWGRRASRMNLGAGQARRPLSFLNCAIIRA